MISIMIMMMNWMIISMIIRMIDKDQVLLTEGPIIIIGRMTVTMIIDDRRDG
jgi:hypothetical protein